MKLIIIKTTKIRNFKYIRYKQLLLRNFKHTWYKAHKIKYIKTLKAHTYFSGNSVALRTFSSPVGVEERGGVW